MTATILVLTGLLSTLLDVPFLAQPPALCGGAAVAMVMRYWGTSDVLPQDFAPLVSRDADGIPTDTLSFAVRERGWQSHVLALDITTGRSEIRSQLGAGRPLIALIAVAPRVYHYVVIVGVTDNEVIVHDPARAPYRVVPWTDFDREWNAAGRWLLLILPPPASSAATTRAPAAVIAVSDAMTPCTALTNRGVELAIDGDVVAAEQSLAAAIALCPADPAPLREMAGLRFSQRRWLDVDAFGLRAVALAPTDTYTWQLIASSRYVSGHPIEALRASNRTGEPRIDAIEIHGANRTPLPVVLRASGLESRTVLTPALLGRAERRLEALPAADGARIAYTPIDGGRAQVPSTTDLGSRFAGSDSRGLFLT